MKFGSISYRPENLSTCEIAGAVALCAVHDLRVNLFRFGGFPHIVVVEEGEGFKVTIAIHDDKVIEDTFLLTREEAFSAARSFKRPGSEFNPAIFDRVQASLARVVG